MTDNRLTSRDVLFGRFIAALIVVMTLYGLGLAVAVVTDSAYASRMIGAFSSMFAGVLGLGTGYLFGARMNGNGRNHE